MEKAGAGSPDIGVWQQRYPGSAAEAKIRIRIVSVVADQADVYFVFLKKFQGLVGGLAGDCNTDLRIGSNEIFQPGHKYIFA